MTLGERIKELRKEQGLTLVKLAGSKITKGMLSLIENNKSNPSMETLEYLAEQLGVSVSYLTQQGDSEWTKKMLEREEFYNIFDFPTEIIEKEVLPNREKISESKDGMTLYHVLRIYYRYIGEPEKAEDITDHIDKFYKNIGLENLAVKDKLNNAVSMMYQQDYKGAYEKIEKLESEVEKYKEYDGNMYADYLFWRSIFAADFDIEDFIAYGELYLTESFKIENFKNYYLQNVAFGLYYSHTGNYEKAEVYQENVRKYLAFNQSSRYRFEVMDMSEPIQVFLILKDNPNIVAIYESYMNKMYRYVKGEVTDSQLNLENIKQFIPIFELELEYFKGNFKYVIDNFNYDMYERPQAQHPLDRIIFAIRTMVYPLSLYKVGEIEEAKESYLIIEETVKDIKNSIYAKEMHMIKDIIFK